MLEMLTPNPRRPATPTPGLADLRLAADGSPRRAPPFSLPGGEVDVGLAGAGLLALLAAMLDEVDYPMVLIGGHAQVMHANKLARSELSRDHPLQMIGEVLRVRDSQDLLPFAEAVHEAQARGMRRLLTLGRESQQPVTLSVVPLNAAPGAGSAGPGRAQAFPIQPAPVLLMLGKRQVCGDLLVHWYARSQGLTPAETVVLKHLCDGEQPTAIAKTLGVAISTVRSQISSIRAKTGAQSIRELVRQVAILPPLVNLLGSTGS